VGLSADGLREISGRFFRVIEAGDDDPLSAKAHRTPGRFHRAGERALYISPSPDSAAIAIGHRVLAGDKAARTLIGVELKDAIVIDLLDEQACARFGITYADAAAPWMRVFEAGKTPLSWAVADKLRSRGVHGLIDPSRRAPGYGLWRITLFRWNESGAPRVTQIGGKKAIKVPPDYRGGANLMAAR
jgi:RES domain-containing protein